MRTVRRVRIVLVIAVLVMLAVRRAPPDHWTLRCHAAENREEDRNWPACRERLVRVETVITDRDTEAGDDVHPDKKPNVKPAEVAAPREDHRANERQGRNDDCNRRCESHREWCLAQSSFGGQGREIRFRWSGRRIGGRGCRGMWNRRSVTACWHSNRGSHPNRAGQNVEFMQNRCVDGEYGGFFWRL
jgi:hypothetical protein